MRKPLVRSFLAAQALVGIVLTIVWLARLWESRSFITFPLYGISGLLLVGAFVPSAWIRGLDRRQNTPASIPNHLPLDPRGRGGFICWNRFSIQALLTCAFVAITALLLQFAPPIPGA
jgi:hypothetical protein